MKILIIIPSLGYGGAEKLVIEWIRCWLAADQVSSVTLVSPMLSKVGFSFRFSLLTRFL